jgi:hypothetical protein
MSLNSFHGEIDKLISRITNQGQNDLTTSSGSFEWINAFLKGSFGGDSFISGAALNKTLLPGETIEVTQLLPKKQCSNWCITVNQVIINSFILIPLFLSLKL